MALWQYGLVTLAFAWAAQVWGVWRQTRHYQRVFAEIRRHYADGALGTGAAQAKFGKGAIAIVVVDRQDVVRAVRVMQGLSVLAQFVERPELEGLTRGQLAAATSAPGFSRPLAAALTQALAQIDKVAWRERSAPKVALSPA